MKKIGIFSTCCLLLFCHPSFAWNWNGVLKTKLQTDNRYTNDARAFNEVWGSLEVFDYDTWWAGLDFVSRQSSEKGFEGDIFQFYIDKKLTDWNTRIRVGRFQRADSIGYYAIDGMRVSYQLPKSNWGLQFYTGVPRRLEDVRSVDGDWVYGVDANWNKKIGWKSNFITADHVYFRAGFQQFADQDVATRFTLSSTIKGQFPVKFLHAYEVSIMTTYETETDTVEDLLIDSLLDFSEDIRLRSSYELYQPRAPYVSFREKFYSVYAFGRQDLFKLNINNQVDDYFSYSVGFKQATRRSNDDVGYGANMGAKWDYLRNIALAAEFDYLALGGDKSESIYLAADYTVNMDVTAGLDIALANNIKQLYGNNQSVGFELNGRYRIDRNLFLKVSASYINYSQIDSEYLGAVQLTWYLDQFQAKQDR